MDGSVNVATCKNVKEYQIEKNSGFRIYTHEGAVQLAALTDNIRLGWIQAFQVSGASGRIRPQQVVEKITFAIQKSEFKI